MPDCVTLRRTLPKSCATPQTESGACSRTFKYLNTLGLHARPAALLVRTVSPFKCGVTAQQDGYQADVRSILSLLLLAVDPGSQITFTAHGPDAAAALAAIARLFENHFGEAYSPHSIKPLRAEVAPTA
jgi:phosphotransferase system HPr (HPr) family protein